MQLNVSRLALLLPVIFLSTVANAEEDKLATLEAKLSKLETELNSLKKSTNNPLSSTKIKGLVQYDANFYDGVLNNNKGGGNGSDIALRRLHLRVGHQANDKLSYSLLLFGSETSTKILVGFARYQPNKNWEFRFGKIKEDRSLALGYIGEEVTAERPMVVNAFATAFQSGIQGHYVNDNFRVSAAVVEDKKYLGELRSEGKMALGYNLRGTWNQVNESSVLHLGTSYSYRDMNDETFQLKSKAGFLRSVDSDVLSSGTLASAKHADIAMAEFAYQYDAFRIEAEYGHMNVRSGLASQDDLSFDGYYVTLGYFLDGETHLKYSKKYAKFGGPSNPNGTWQVYARYSALDLINSETGNKGDVTMLGANYYFNFNWNVQMQYYDVDTQGPASATKLESEGKGLAVRLNYRF